MNFAAISQAMTQPQLADFAIHHDCDTWPQPVTII
jgi:hypothetical protein